MAQLDITPYLEQKATMQRVMKNNEGKDINEMIGLVSLATGIPILAVAIIVGSFHGFSPEILAQIKSLQSFYKYSNVITGDIILPIELEKFV